MRKNLVGFGDLHEMGTYGATRGSHAFDACVNAVQLMHAGRRVSVKRLTRGHSRHGEVVTSVEDNTDRPSASMALVSVLGTAVGSAVWTALLGADAESLEVRTYPDIHYYNARTRGVSFQVDPTTSRVLTIDVYNAQPRWGTYAAYPILIRYWTENTHERHLEITPTTKAIDLVQALGEPTRKGGAEAGGPTARALGPAMWTEWALAVDMPSVGRTTLYLLAEYAGEAARACDRWEPGRGSESVWATLALSLVPPP